MLFSLCLGAFCIYIMFCLVNEYGEYGLPFELGFFLQGKDFRLLLISYFQRLGLI